VRVLDLLRGNYGKQQQSNNDASSGNPSPDVHTPNASPVHEIIDFIPHYKPQRISWHSNKSKKKRAKDEDATPEAPWKKDFANGFRYTTLPQSAPALRKNTPIITWRKKANKNRKLL